MCNIIIETPMTNTLS